MNSHQTKPHRVEAMSDCRFAVINPTGETVAVLSCEALAISVAASLDSEPVRSAFPGGRWTEKEKAA